MTRLFLSAEDPKLAEFLQLMQPRRAGAIWSNEDTELAAAAAQTRTAAGKAGSTAPEASNDGKALAGDRRQASKGGRMGPGKDATEEEAGEQC